MKQTVMRNGILFFWGMDRIRALARFAVLPFFFITINTEPGTLIFFFSLAVLILSAFLSFLPTPTDKKLQLVITDFQAELKEQTLRAAVAKNEDLMLILNGYQERGKMVLKRQLGKDMIYPHLASVALYCKDNNYTLVLGTKSLLSVAPPVYTKIKFTKEVLAFELSEDTEKVIIVKLHAPELPEDFVLYIKNDYHYRDFLAAVKSYQP